MRPCPLYKLFFLPGDRLWRHRRSASSNISDKGAGPHHHRAGFDTKHIRRASPGISPGPSANYHEDRAGRTVEKRKFRVTNFGSTGRPSGRRPTFNVSPEMAGAYFQPRWNAFASPTRP